MIVIDNWFKMDRKGIVDEEFRSISSKNGVINIFRKLLNVELKIVVVLFFFIVFVKIIVDDIGGGI